MKFLFILLCLWMSMNVEARQNPKSLAKPTVITSDVQSDVTRQAVKKELDTQESKDLILLDSIEAIIYDEQGTSLVTRSDITKPTLSGGIRTLQDTIFENLLFLDAKKHKIAADAQARDRYLSHIMSENHLTADDMDRIFAQAGYTAQEGREQLSFMQSINSMLEFKIRSNLVVPRKDIELYYNEHPQYSQERYSIAYAHVSYNKKLSRAKQKNMLSKARVSNKNTQLAWSEPLWINASDLASDKKFISLLEIEAVSDPIETDDGFVLYKLIDKQSSRLLTLDERRQEIVDLLRAPIYQEMLDTYRKELFNRASVVYFTSVA